MSSAPAKTITLKSCDEQMFVIEEATSLQSKTLENMIVDNPSDENIRLTTTITANVLAKVIVYLNKHGEVETSDEDKKIWDAQFVNFDNANQNTLPPILFDMIQAAKILEIKGLSDLTAQKVAGWIQGKRPDEIIEMYPSCDEHMFIIEEATALQSKTLENMIADNPSDENIPVKTTITANILAKVIEYLNKHAEVETSDEDKKIWDAQFVNFDNTNQNTLPPIFFDMIQAAKVLEIKGLSDLTAQKVADWIQGKTPDEINDMFPVKNQLTPGEEEWIRRENQCAFQD
ncbi:hypothetical protein C5167_047212 [Papaver somniferum]|uniref:SKP1-like protein n=1 Tax=Papaver somniferum TaxID=3469 RepID=A0A4Y7LGQ8_PAPSO|nr:hypothetical protein C5167_047212 [Papaver somniferum]